MDPTDMTDEELNKVISGEQPEETATNPEEPAASPQEETPAPEPEPAEEAPEPEAPPAEEEPPAPSRREQLRVAQLLQKYGPPPEKPAAPSQNPDDLDFSEVVNADPELIEDMNKRARDYAENQYKRGQSEALKAIDASEWRTMLNIDAPTMEQKYPVLDKSSEQFHPALADALSRRYLQMVGFDPVTKHVERKDIRWKDFIESEFELAEEIASFKVSETTKNVVTQAAQTGLRPDGSSARGMDLNKSADEMTNEELNAAISATMPRDSRGRFTPRN